MQKSTAEVVKEIISKNEFSSWYQLRDQYVQQFREHGDGYHPDKMFRHARTYSKYFDLEYHFQYHLRFIRILGLDSSVKSKRILDVGCGAGLFLYLCQHYGHSGIGLDIGSDMYQRMAGVLEVNYRNSPVLAYSKLPADLVGFDVISAIAVKFDRLDWGPQGTEPWAFEEWQFFLKDAAQRLNRKGEIFLKPNLVDPKNPEPRKFFADERIEPFLQSISHYASPHGDFLLRKEAVLQALR